MIRRLRKGDEKRWLAAVQELISAEDREGELISESELSKALEDSRCYLYLAFIDSSIVGLANAFRFPNVEAGGEMVYLYDIEVAQSFRKKGIGSALIKQLMNDCKEDDVDFIWAGTERKNLAARKTFEATAATLEGDAYVEYEWDLED